MKYSQICMKKYAEQNEAKKIQKNYRRASKTQFWDLKTWGQEVPGPRPPADPLVKSVHRGTIGIPLCTLITKAQLLIKGS